MKIRVGRCLNVLRVFGGREREGRLCVCNALFRSTRKSVFVVVCITIRSKALDGRVHTPGKSDVAMYSGRHPC